MVVVAGELAARISGVGARCPNLHVATMLWACDPILGTRMRSDLSPGGERLDRAGFRTRELRAKAAGTYRVLALGDSCTLGMVALDRFTWIAEPYPQGLERRAAARSGARHVEVLNAGQAGYTSYHGVMLLRGKLRGLTPDLITVRYGWNDHFSLVDDDGVVLRESPSALVRWVEDLLLPTALYGVARRIPLEVAARLGSPPRHQLPQRWVPAIPLDLYAHNLERIVALGREQGSEVWLLTSPHAFVVEENRGRYAEVPATVSGRLLLSFNGLPSFERLIEIHESYNAKTREVGAALGVPVVDMEAHYRERAHARLFELSDVVHPTQEGHDLEAEVLLKRLGEGGIIAESGAALNEARSELRIDELDLLLRRQQHGRHDQRHVEHDPPVAGDESAEAHRISRSRAITCWAVAKSATNSTQPMQTK